MTPQSRDALKAHRYLPPPLYRELCFVHAALACVELSAAVFALVSFVLSHKIFFHADDTKIYRLSYNFLQMKSTKYSQNLMLKAAFLLTSALLTETCVLGSE